LRIAPLAEDGSRRERQTPGLHPAKRRKQVAKYWLELKPAVKAMSVMDASGRVSSMRAACSKADQQVRPVLVPLAGRLPAWSPVSVTVNGRPQSALRREDGFLWLDLPAGVNRGRVDGLLADVPEWEWSFHLKPRRVIIELGLIWQVRTTVRRLSPPGKALESRVPLAALGVDPVQHRRMFPESGRNRHPAAAAARREAALKTAAISNNPPWPRRSLPPHGRR
jgi:hypothetical protein